MMLEVQLRQTPVISGVFWSAPKPCPMGEIQLLGGLDVRDCVLLLEAGSLGLWVDSKTSSGLGCETS